MRVTIDRAKCSGHAMCYRTAPHIFELDDEGFGYVVAGYETVPADEEHFVRAAVINCPEEAVIITEE